MLRKLVVLLICQAPAAGPGWCPGCLSSKYWDWCSSVNASNIEIKVSASPPEVQWLLFHLYLLTSTGFWFQPYVSPFKLLCVFQGFQCQFIIILPEQIQPPGHLQGRASLFFSRSVDFTPEILPSLCQALPCISGNPDIEKCQNRGLPSFVGFLSSLWHDICCALHFPFLGLCWVCHSLCVHGEMAQLDSA